MREIAKGENNKCEIKVTKKVKTQIPSERTEKRRSIHWEK